jgi:BirA family transcriptional regulator, biotin operon repressor / biotin---[acetyl-CoA-carboxylase] ligase
MIGSTILRIPETDSSNNYAANLLLTKRLTEGIVLVADSQIDGRGQASNKWESEPGKNLTFSIVLFPEFLEISRQFELSKAISLGVSDYLTELIDNVSIKWPNDIYIGNCKVAGILIENSVRLRTISTCIVGIGLNINQQLFLSDAPNPCSLFQITGKEYDLKESLSDLCLKIDSRYQQLRTGEFRKIDEDYSDSLYLREIWAPYADESGDFEGKLLGVDPTGQLRIQTKSGKINRYQFKEVTFRR